MIYHSDGYTADNAFSEGLLFAEGWEKTRLSLVIGCCWDADRLDLLRLGIEPDSRKMSTPHWTEVLQKARLMHK